MAVAGGGIAGLTAAADLASAGHAVTVLEAAADVGGKLRLAEVAGVTVDVGAEAMLDRRPDGVALARTLGLAVEHPAVTASKIWSRGALRPLPRSLLGAPLDLADLAASGVLSGEGVTRAWQEAELPPEEGLADPAADLSVGELVDRRFGTEVTDRLVEPLLGGVYAGRARRISARAAAPQLVELAGRGSIVAQASAQPDDRPVFAGVTGGMGRLPPRLVEALEAAGCEVRTGAVVRRLVRTADGLRLTVGPVTAAEELTADAVVLAVPPAPASRLLAEVAPVAAAALADVETASTAAVTLAFRAADVPESMAEASGFLVPPVEGRRIKAATYSFAKWAWSRQAAEVEGLRVLRTSLGRHGEAAPLQATDEELVAWSLADLSALTGLTARPVAWHVQRWGGGLPQYSVGHLDRVARIRADVGRLPGLVVCGAAYDGVGVPAVIGSGHRAAAELAAQWANEQ